MSDNTQGNAPSTSGVPIGAQISTPAVEGLEVVAYADFDDDGEIWWGKESCFSDEPDWLENPGALVRHSDAARLIAERDARIAELEEYSSLVQLQVARVYMAVTGGLCSKENTDAEVVISLFDEYLEKRVDEQTARRLADLEKARTEPVAIVGELYEQTRAEVLGKGYPVGAYLYAAPPDAQAIIDGLRAELERWKGSGTHGQIAQWRDAANERDALRAEVERLRAELAATNALADRLSKQSSEYFMGERTGRKAARRHAGEGREEMSPCDGCSAQRIGRLCANGFPIPYGSAQPWCLREDINPIWLDDSGKPKFAQYAINSEIDTMQAKEARK